MSVHEHPSTKIGLLKRLIHGHSRTRFDLQIFDIRNDSYNPQRLRIYADKLHYRIAPGHVAADSLLAGKRALRPALTDDDNALLPVAIPIIEVAPSGNRNS